LLFQALGVTEAKDGGIDSRDGDCIPEWLTTHVVRIDEGKRFVDKHGAVRKVPVQDSLVWKQVRVILANAAHFRMFLEELFEPPFIFNEL
jgi:hypothetical protein